MKKIRLPKVPQEDVKDGLLCHFAESGGEGLLPFAFSDIEKGQRNYDLPPGKRQIKGIYMKIL